MVDRFRSSLVWRGSGEARVVGGKSVVTIEGAPE
jgi:hypothetical protein